MDIDHLARAMKDLEYRVKQLEKWQSPKTIWMGEGKVVQQQFCPCGRDVCRAPDCPSHKPDPMGR